MRSTKWTCSILLLLSVGVCAQTPAATPAAADASNSGVVQNQAASQPQAAPSPAPPPASVAAPSSGPSAKLGAAAPPATIEQVEDRFIAREKALVQLLKDRTPVVETYLQNVKADADIGQVPVSDKYFLGHMDLGEDIDHRTYLKDSAGIQKRLFGGFNKLFTVQYKLSLIHI